MTKNLFEHVVNIFDKEPKREYLERILPLIRRTYQHLGGIDNVNFRKLILDSGKWKLVKRGEDITAGVLYRDLKGNKIRLVFSDGTPAGKADVKKILQDDLIHGRAWVEASGPLEKYLLSIGAPKVKATLAPKILGRDLVEIEDDGFHYKRFINGKVLTKIIIGHPSIS
jgi:hypothetical protein